MAQAELAKTVKAEFQSVSILKGIAGVQAGKLARMGIHTLGDLVEHYPVRWIDRSRLRELGNFVPEDVNAVETGEDGRERKRVYTVVGRIAKVTQSGGNYYTRRRKIPSRLTVKLEDDSGSLDLVFFGGAWRKTQFETGSYALASGTLRAYRRQLQMQNPEYEVLSTEDEAGFYAERLFPIYSSTKGITQRQLRWWIKQALSRLRVDLDDPVPRELTTKYKFPGRLEAFHNIHFPESEALRDASRRRLAYEELFLDQAFMTAIRLRRESGALGSALTVDGELRRAVSQSLPFELTGDQNTALEEILGDLRLRRPMNRLLQGDVGSGKTVVAALAAAHAVDNGKQAAFLVPTEILAEQHHRTLSQLCLPLGLEPRLLTGSTKGAARREALRDVATGSARLVVGTHAIFQEEVRFHDLGLVVVDEQHRFGVMQRLALWKKGSAPHLLAMSATPIPRSLAMVRYADLDLSVIQEKPKGRGEIISRVTTEAKREALYGFVRQELKAGRQAYVIYPLVEDSDKSDLKAAVSMAETLSAHEAFRGFQVGLLHGKMRAEEKDRVMRSFVAGDIHLLVATTVIEVGIDVPNATVMIIEHPERYGLSQLHQLRGRIGRGKHTSYCVLVLGSGVGAEARSRLKAFSGTDDGFEIARMDLLLRGRGDLLGTRQSGRPGYKLADPFENEAMVRTAREDVLAIMGSGRLEDPDPNPYGALRDRLAHFLKEVAALAEVG